MDCNFLNLGSMLRYLALVVLLNNFLLIDATDRSMISSDQKCLFFAVSLYPLLFFRTLHLKPSSYSKVFWLSLYFTLFSFSTWPPSRISRRPVTIFQRKVYRMLIGNVYREIVQCPQHLTKRSTCT